MKQVREIIGDKLEALDINTFDVAYQYDNGESIYTQMEIHVKTKLFIKFTILEQVINETS